MNTFEHSNPEETSRRERQEKLESKLETIFALGGSVLGHGTYGVEQAENILRIGLNTSYGRNLGASAVELERGKDGIAQILNWGHRNSKYIVIISIPKTYQKSPGELDWGTRLFEDIAEKNDIDADAEFRELKSLYTSQNAKLPSKYIAGYVDSEKFEFIPNPSFEENPTLPDPIILSGSHLDFIKTRDQSHEKQKNPSQEELDSWVDSEPE